MMSRRFGCGLLVTASLVAASTAAADPITIVERSSGIAVLAIASDGGLTERRAFPYRASEDVSRTLTSTAGSTASSAFRLETRLYHLLVQSSAIGSNAFGPAAIDSASSFAFTSNLIEADAAPVPEPASLILLGTGLAGTFAAARRRRAAAR